MNKPIPKTPKSDELLKVLTTLPTNMNAIESLLKTGGFSADDVSRAGFDYAEECFFDCLDYYDAHEEAMCSPATAIPDILSSRMFEVFELLLRYGLNPNAICDEQSVLGSVTWVSNGYIAADTLTLLIEHGGDPFSPIYRESLFEKIDFAVFFDAVEMENRSIYDSTVHCWMVLLGYSGNTVNGTEIVRVFNKHICECEIEDFKISDLKQHRNYYYGISHVSERGERWSLHIFDKRTRCEVARL